MAWTEIRNGRYVGFYRDAQGRKHRAGVHDKKRAALAAARDQEAAIRLGTWANPITAESITLDRYFYDQWLPNRNRSVLTRRNYLANYELSIKPRFGSTPIGQITRGDIQRWVIDMEKGVGRERPLAPDTIRARFLTLSSILGAKNGVSAVFDELIPSNPCSLVTTPKRSKAAPKTYEVTEIEALLSAMDPWWHPQVLFLVESGVRWGEMLGLRVGDFEQDFHIVNVRRTIIRCSRKAAESLGLETSGFMWKDTTKSDRDRRIGLGPEIATTIREAVRDRGLFPMDRMFSWPDRHDRTRPQRTEAWPEGHPIHEGRFYTEVWRPAHEATGVEIRKLHALRASHISWLLAGGLDVVSVQKRVGHVDLATTQRYAAALGDADTRAISALATTRRRAHGS